MLVVMSKSGQCQNRRGILCWASQRKAFADGGGSQLASDSPILFFGDIWSVQVLDPLLEKERGRYPETAPLAGHVLNSHVIIGDLRRFACHDVVL